MTFDPRAEGFAWPAPSQVQNASGTSMRIAPATLRAHSDTAKDEREKECYRLYDTPMGLLSELEIKHWQAGGFQAEQGLVDAYARMFTEAGKNTLPLQTVIDSLRQGGFSVIQIEVVVGWLIRGRYVAFDRDALTIGALQ